MSIDLSAYPGIAKLAPKDRENHTRLLNARRGLQVIYQWGGGYGVDRMVMRVYVRTDDDRVFIGVRSTHRQGGLDGSWRLLDPAVWKEDGIWMSVAEFAWKFFSRMEIP